MGDAAARVADVDGLSVGQADQFCGSSFASPWPYRTFQDFFV